MRVLARYAPFICCAIVVTISIGILFRPYYAPGRKVIIARRAGAGDLSPSRIIQLDR